MPMGGSGDGSPEGRAHAFVRVLRVMDGARKFPWLTPTPFPWRSSVAVGAIPHQRLDQNLGLGSRARLRTKLRVSVSSTVTGNSRGAAAASASAWESPALR